MMHFGRHTVPDPCSESSAVDDYRCPLDEESDNWQMLGDVANRIFERIRQQRDTDDNGNADRDRNPGRR